MVSVKARDAGQKERKCGFCLYFEFCFFAFVENVVLDVPYKSECVFDISIKGSFGAGLAKRWGTRRKQDYLLRMERCPQRSVYKFTKR